MLISGTLDFHLKKMKSLIEVDSEGKYSLNSKGVAALEAIRIVERYGWQKRSFILNLLAYILINIWALVTSSISLIFSLSFLHQHFG